MGIEQEDFKAIVVEKANDSPKGNLQLESLWN